jgi:hypothetical protein
VQRCKNFRLFINNMILCLCANTQSNNQLYCKDMILCLCANTQSNNQLYCKDMDIYMSIDIYKYFIDGINI